jgi:hypothetical protein
MTTKLPFRSPLSLSLSSLFHRQACLGCARLCSHEEAVLHMQSQPVSPVGLNAHCTYADIERAELFCAACVTYVYALEFDSTVGGCTRCAFS